MRYEVETASGGLAAVLEDREDAKVFVLSLRPVELLREDIGALLVAAVLLIDAN